MLFLSISIWVVFVYSLKVFITGNPAYVLVNGIPSVELEQASECLENDMIPDNENVCLFIKRFFRLTALACFLFFVEFTIILYFIYAQPSLFIPWFILIKNVIMLGIGYRLHQQSSNNIFEAIQQIPQWAMRWERISYLFTAICFLLFFLLVNKLVVL